MTTATPRPRLEHTVVRELNLSHMGRWILIDAGAAHENAAGRLVGIRPGKKPTGVGARGTAPASFTAATRILVLQQGNLTSAVEWAVDITVHVAPRSWS